MHPTAELLSRFISNNSEAAEILPPHYSSDTNTLPDKVLGLVMFKKFLIVWMAAGFGAISGCDQEVGGLEVPVLPIVQDAVFEVVPLVNGVRNLAVIENICALARKEISLGDVEARLRKSGVDPEKLKQSKGALSLLVTQDQSGQISVCAASIATSALMPINISEFVSVAPAEVGAKSNKGEKNDSPTDASLSKEIAVNRDMLASTLRVKLAVSQANAEIFALIGSELQREAGLPLNTLKEKAKILFGKYSPMYLSLVKSYMDTSGVTYNVERMESNSFRFSDSRGYHFSFEGGSVVLKRLGVNIYGEGELLGRKYMAEVDYFAKAQGEKNK